MSVTMQAIDVAAQVSIPTAGPWIPWPGDSPEPGFLGSLRTNISSNTTLQNIFKTIGVIILLIWVGYVLVKIALPSGRGGGGARSISWIGATMGLVVAAICLNLAAVPNILSAVLLAGASFLRVIGLTG